MNAHLRSAWSRRITGSLPVGEYVFWRLHDPRRPFGNEDAHSRVFRRDWDTGQLHYQDDTRLRGYSAFDNPWHLFDYLRYKGWQTSGMEVIAFMGFPESTSGHDGELLVVPVEGEAPVARMSWDQFVQALRTTSMGDPPSWGRMRVHDEDWGDPEAFMAEEPSGRTWTGLKTASTITYEVVPTWLEDWPEVVARDGDRIVGRLSFNRRWGNIEKVAVDPAYRRRGIATRMAEVAKGHGTFEEFNLGGGDYSEEGAAWASSLSGREVYPTWASPPDFTTWMLGSKTAMPVGPPPSGLRYLVTWNNITRGVPASRSYCMMGAFLGDEMVAHMTWGIQGRKVQSIWVAPQYRRRRIAETMFNAAKQVDPSVTYHADRTDAGDAWTKAMFPDAPDRLHNTTEESYGDTGGGSLIRQRLLEPRHPEEVQELSPAMASKTARFQHPVGVLEAVQMQESREGQTYTTVKAAAARLYEALWSAGHTREFVVADTPSAISADLIGDRTGLVVVTHAPEFFGAGAVGADAIAFVSTVPGADAIDYGVYLSRLPVSEMVLLHEAAHLIDLLQGGGGHDAGWLTAYLSLLDGAWDDDLNGFAHLLRFTTGVGAG